VACGWRNVTPSTRIPETLGCCKSSSNSSRFARLPQTPSSIHHLLFLEALSSKIAIYSCSMRQTGQRPATDPYISIPRRLQDSWRDSTSHPQAVSLWGLGVPDWRRCGGRWTCGVLRSWRAEVWGCEAGGRRVRWHMLWIHVSWRVWFRGDRMKMCARLRAWPHSLLVPSRERLRHGKYGSSNQTHAWQCNVCLE
jgi:hypothetical protein